MQGIEIPDFGDKSLGFGAILVHGQFEEGGDKSHSLTLHGLAGRKSIFGKAFAREAANYRTYGNFRS